jgi:hypothetical protein
MTLDEPEEGTGGIPSRWKAFAISLGVDLVCLPLVMVILVYWPIVILAIVPYIGGALGGRYTDRRNGLLMGALAAIIMVTVLAILFLRILRNLPGEGFDFFEPIGLSILGASYLVAFIFGALGGRHGAISSEGDEE